MYPEGTIYSYNSGRNSGEKKLHATLFVKFLYRFVQVFSAGVVTAAILMALLFWGPMIHEEAKYDLRVSKNNSYFDLVEALEANSVSSVQAAAAEYGVDPYFSIVVPKIEAASNIVPNVDITDEALYMGALEQGVAHAAGTHFPGQGESIYLFSHSTDSPLNVTRLNAVFYLLRKLEPGDQVLVFFADKLYQYEVDYKTVVPSSDVSWLAHDFGTEHLVLQTCDPPGTSINRMIITAKLVRKIG
jgi:sortase A